MDDRLNDMAKSLYALKRLDIGFCPICESKTIFYSRYDWLRDHYRCIGCDSIPRHRALIKYFKIYFPDYKKMVIHESAPFEVSSNFLRKNCNRYSSSHYSPDISRGTMHNGYRCEDLESLTFPDASFDLFVTQDVLEHIVHPDRALREVCRVLKPGGAHIFTMPYHPNMRNELRVIERDGKLHFLKEPVYHGNPVDNKGSLVIYDWGWDFADYCYKKQV